MQKIGSYPYFNTLFSITIAMFLTGVLSIFSIQVHKITTLLHNNLEIQVFLDYNLTQEEIDNIYSQLLEKEYLSLDIMPNLYFISKQEAAEKIIAETGEDFIEFLGENPLHDAFFMHIKNTYSKQQLQNIKNELENVEGVYEIVQTQDILAQLNKNLKKIGLVVSSVIFLFIIVIITLINSAIRLALFSQRFLIRSMKLVGATDRFIKRPFLLNAAWQGTLGAILANLMVLSTIYLIILYFQDIQIFRDHTTYLVMFAIVGLSVIISVLSTYFATRQYLKMNLEELY